MALTQEDASVLAQQLQDAHRYAAGFYHRFLPMMNTAARTHGFEPTSWEMVRFDSPPIRKKTPEGKWVWDLLPMCNTLFSFSRLEATKVDLDVWFTPDPGLNREGFPDPFDMDDEKPLVTIDAYASDNTVPTETTIGALWQSTGKPKPEENDKLIKYPTGLLSIRKTISLAEFMLAPEKAIKDVLQSLIIETT